MNNGDEANLIEYINFVPGFVDYRAVAISDKLDWYKTSSIYTNNVLDDNTSAFINLSGNSFNTLNKMINLQPNL